MGSQGQTVRNAGKTEWNLGFEYFGYVSLDVSYLRDGKLLIINFFIVTLYITWMIAKICIANNMHKSGQYVTGKFLSAHKFLTGRR